MSDAATASPLSHAAVAEPASGGGAPGRVTELKVSGHLMTLETGLFCIMQTPRPAAPRDGSGLPGVRVSAAPGAASGGEAVSITTFRDDGWLGGPDDAALVRVAAGPAQILVTIYQSPAHGADAAPRMQVLRLSPDPVPEAAAPPLPAASPASPTGEAEVVAHVSRAGDITARLGEWIGVRGSRQWIEGFGIAPRNGEGGQGIAPEDIEYQAVLGRGWLSPWMQGGRFCGSRGMALPVLGLRVRLRGAAAGAFECHCSATFIDGAEIGPVPAGAACEAESLAPLEAFQVTLTRRRAAPAPIARPARPEPPPPPRTARVLKSAKRPR